MKVTVHRGEYRLMGRQIDVSNREFVLTQDLSPGSDGSFICVDPKGHRDLPNKIIKIHVNSERDFSVHGSQVQRSSVDTSITSETDQQIIDRLRVRFAQLEDMTRAVKSGKIRALIVSGAPGVGKSHGVERVLSRHQTVASLGGPVTFEVVKGAISALGLYSKLYQYRTQGSVVVFDDCDSVFSDELSLNILKAALDSKARRVICWNSNSIRLRDEGIPNSFEFSGSCIFITNIKFDGARGKIRDHLAALASRCHMMDLTIHNNREKLLRIHQIVKDGMLNSYGFSPQTLDEILNYVVDNQLVMRELSLRAVVKLADLVSAFPDNWRSFAQNTL